ncbi:hypothetical protein AX16_008292 [Volvariella volvacea WC 439]|nr:hypothetical protein AX16_008292 [Volvariella volvacea WC 439]
MADTNPEHYSPSPLECCPNEVLLKIEEHLREILDLWMERKKQMLALRLTCRRLETFFTQFVITELHLSCNIGWNEEGRLKGLHTNPSFPPNVFVPFISCINISFSTSWHGWEVPSYDPQEVLELFPPVWDELGRYTSLTSLSVHWAWGSPPELYHYLASRLVQVIHQRTAGRLSQLCWSCDSRLQTQLPMSQILQLFSGLQKLELDVFTDHDSPQPISLGDTILRNPGIQFLRIKCELPHPFCTMEELFPSKLHELAIEEILVCGTLPSAPQDVIMGVPSSIPPHNFPNIRNLKRLTIRFGEQHPIDMVNLDRLWHALRASGARLLEVSLDYGISDALMEYLSSYEGLTKGWYNMRIPSTQGGPPPSHTFAEAIHHHKSSLAELRMFLGTSWSLAQDCREDMVLDPATWPVPSSFLRLKTLSIIPPLAWKLTADNLQLLLDYVSEMPVIETLDVAWQDEYVPDFGLRIERIGKRVFIKRSKLESITIIVTEFSFVSRVVWSIRYSPLKEYNTNKRFMLNGFHHRCTYWDDDSSDS